MISANRVCMWYDHVLLGRSTSHSNIVNTNKLLSNTPGKIIIQKVHTRKYLLTRNF